MLRNISYSVPPGSKGLIWYQAICLAYVQNCFNAKKKKKGSENVSKMFLACTHYYYYTSRRHYLSLPGCKTES